MKPFDPTKPCQYRNGKSCIILTTKGRYEYEGVPQPIVTEDELGNITTHRTDGRLLPQLESDYDLININAKKTVELWVNVYPDGVTIAWPTKRCATEFARSEDLFARKKITFEVEEGEGL
jgi:hypothetical protein